MFGTTTKKPGPAQSRRQQADAMRRRVGRASAKLVQIPTLSPKDRKERERREANDAIWLKSYWSAFSPDEFYRFSSQQTQMIADFNAALTYGGDRATAASRGEGKTTFAVALTVKHVLTGRLNFVLLLAATADNVGEILAGINTSLSVNEELRHFYPEVCVPVADVATAPQRAASQIASGFRHDNGQQFESVASRFHWADDTLIFPNVPGSPSAGAIIKAKSLRSPVRGLKIANRRPDIVLIDDPDTDETIANPEQARKLLVKLDYAISALGSQKRPITRIALVTIASQSSAAARLTDRTQYPSWRGRRYRFLESPPDNTALWDEFVALCREGWAQSDDDQDQPPIPAVAHNFYRKRRKKMDAGAKVSNPNRYDHRPRPEGGTVEISALEHYYGFVARNGQQAASTELDNDPPAADETAGDRLTPYRVQLRVSGLPYRQVPDHTIRITQGIDIGKRWLHWAVRAWVQRPDDPVATGHTIDYGETPTTGTVVGSEEGIDEAIKRALRARDEQIARDPYCTAAGQVRDIDLTLIDCQYRMEAIYDYCMEAGQYCIRARGSNGRYSPSAGVGASGGAIRENWTQTTTQTADTIPGDFWKQSKQSNGTWQTRMHADSWKLWEHDRWISDPEAPGGLLVWGELPTPAEVAAGRLSYSQRQHRQPFPSGLPGFADQICAEVEAEEIKNGVTIRRWVSGENLNMKNNHLFDAAYRADVAASMLGVPLLGRRLVAAARPRRRVALVGGPNA